MKAIKVIFISLELAALAAVLMLAFSTSAESDHYVRAAFISLFAVVAVVMQREQQGIKWDEYGK